jgi:undecaprenyl-diphosphatase
LAGLGCTAILWHIFLAAPLLRVDHAVNFFMEAIRTPALDRFFLAWAELGDASVNIPIAITILLFLLFHKCHRVAIFWSLAIAGGAIITKLFLLALQMPKPLLLHGSFSAWDFPGGHVVMTVVLYGFLSILLTRKFHSGWRWIPFWGTFILFGGISFARLYLGAHWLTDILVGLFLGAVWTTLVGLFYLKSPFEFFPKHSLLIVAILTLGCAGGWNIARQNSSEYEYYSNREVTRNLEFGKWWQGGWNRLPAWRIDLGGEKKTPLTIQWTGKKEKLVDAFLSSGWRKPEPFTLRAFLTMLSPDADVNELPVFPRFHKGRIEDVILVRNVTPERWVLRLWATDYTLQPDGFPLFIGTTETEGNRKVGNLIIIPVDRRKYQASQLEIIAELCDLGLCRQVVRPADRIGTRRPSDWKGEVILGKEKGVNY